MPPPKFVLADTGQWRLACGATPGVRSLQRGRLRRRDAVARRAARVVALRDEGRRAQLELQDRPTPGTHVCLRGVGDGRGNRRLANSMQNTTGAPQSASNRITHLQAFQSVLFTYSQKSTRLVSFEAQRSTLHYPAPHSAARSRRSYQVHTPAQGINSRLIPTSRAVPSVPQET